MPAELRFAAMGSDAYVTTIGGSPELVDRGAAIVADLERRWSRFLPSSEISKLNDAPRGRPIIVSPVTFDLVVRMVEAWRRTEGAYDPTVLDAVVAAGYDRSFTALPSDRQDRPDPSSAPAPGCAGIELDAGMLAITLPAAVSLDPGGLGKGFAADLVASALLAQGARGVLADIGGDIRAAGEGPHHGDWVIDVEDPFEPSAPLLHLAVTDVGVATSSRRRRRWRIGGHEHHHLIDPRTGRSTQTDVVSATVIADEAWLAEAFTKAIFVTGDIEAAMGASAVVIDGAGTRCSTRDLMELVS